MKEILGSSFRDPEGFVFHDEGVLYRQVNESGKDNYLALRNSPLLKILTESGKLVHTEEVSLEKAFSQSAAFVLQPEPVPFISYPYEWSFSQLRDAALLTLDIQASAIEHGLSLKDASAYNVQFRKGQPVFIDTLSFERYQEGQPWVAYRQFCQHFLAPLALMSKKDVRLNQLLRVHLDGIPLDLAASLLPGRSKLSPGLFIHLYLHAKAQKDNERRPSMPRAKSSVPKNSILGLIDSLKSTVRNLNWKPVGTEWADYYSFTNYSPEATESKKRAVRECLQKIHPTSVWDIGANDGTYSRIAAEFCSEVVSFDIDPGAVEKNYRACRKDPRNRILPILMDYTNPSPALGWDCEERSSLNQRGPADVILALALIHHLAIGNNLPFSQIAEFFAKNCRWLIIEFVPKGDSQVQRMLGTRKDVFGDYSQEAMEAQFEKYFRIHLALPIENSARFIYFMRTPRSSERQI